MTAKTIAVLISTLAAAGCSDATTVSDEGARRATVRISGASAVEVAGDAFTLRAAGTAAVEQIRMLAVTPSTGYTLTIFFAQPVESSEGMRTVGPAAAAQATLTIFDRRTLQYAEIVDAQSGTLNLQSCSVLRCAGEFSGQFVFSDSLPVTVTATFDARHNRGLPVAGVLTR